MTRPSTTFDAGSVAGGLGAAGGGAELGASELDGCGLGSGTVAGAVATRGAFEEGAARFP